MNLNKYGELIGCEEYTILKNKKIGAFNFITKDITTNMLDKYLCIEAELSIEDGVDKYYTTIEGHIKDSGEKYNIDSESNHIFAKLSDYIDFIEYKIEYKKSKDFVIPTIIHTYENAKIKSDDDFQVTLNTLNNKCNITVPKNCKLVEDRSSFIVYDIETGKEEIRYIIYKDTILSYNLDEFRKPHFRLIEIRSDNTSSIAEIDNFINIIDERFVLIPNLSLRASSVDINDEVVRFEYNMIQSDDTENTTRMEQYISNISKNEELISLISLHKLYYDMFDESMNINRNFWCIDQLEISDSESYYTRSFYNISDEEALLKILRDKPDKAQLELETYDTNKDIIMKSLEK